METRRKKRRHLIHYLEVHEQKTDRLLGHVADITTEGLLLVCEQPLEGEQHFDIEVELPNVPGFEGESLKTAAVVKWNGADKNPALRCVGLQFVNPGPREQSNIELLYKFMGFNE